VSDDQFLLRTRPHTRWWKRISTERWISTVAVIVAAGAAVFSGLQYRAANRQADIAEQTREDAQKASKEQTKDVERARIAAEKSADAALKLAEAGAASAKSVQRTAGASEESAKLARQQLSTAIEALNEERRPFLEVVEFHQSDGDNTVWTRLKNSGRTTAYNTTVTAWIELGDRIQFGVPFTPIYQARLGGTFLAGDIPSDEAVEVHMVLGTSDNVIGIPVFHPGAPVRVHGATVYRDIRSRSYDLDIC
jgi:hypothetical protein